MLDKFTIRNSFLEVSIKKKGAELCSVINTNGTEFIWQAGEIWPRHAPILFPIIGSLIDQEYIIDGKVFPLKHHGFARDIDFEMLHQSEHSICLVLQQNESTKAHYPFDFTLLITYTLDKNVLKQTFRVINNAEDDLLVSFGGHPAFNADPIEDFEVYFEDDAFKSCNLLEGPYISLNKESVVQNNILDITKDTFSRDALVFEGLKSKHVVLRNAKSNYKVKVNISDFPYLGIWAKPGAPYVCIEPWEGLADLVDHDKNFRSKKGVVVVKDEICKSFTMEFTD